MRSAGDHERRQRHHHRRILLIPVFVVLLFSNLPHGDALAAARVRHRRLDRHAGRLCRAGSQQRHHLRAIRRPSGRQAVGDGRARLARRPRARARLGGHGHPGPRVRRERSARGRPRPRRLDPRCRPGQDQDRVRSASTSASCCFHTTPSPAIFTCTASALDAAEWCLLVITVALTVVSGVRYFVNARNVIRVPGSVAR